MERFFFKNNDGSEYEVIFRKPNKKHFGEDCDGICTDPSQEEPKIHINPYLTTQSELNTSIHEFTHAFFWNKSEKDVAHFTNTLSRFLFNYCGCRLPNNIRAKKTRKKRKNVTGK